MQFWIRCLDYCRFTPGLSGIGVSTHIAVETVVYRESHRREWVDYSDPIYRMAVAQSLGIPPTAVGGLFRSNLRDASADPVGIPPTAVGGLFRSNLRDASANPVGTPPTAVGGLFRSNLRDASADPVGTPPTAVGGLFRSFLQK